MKALFETLFMSLYALLVIFGIYRLFDKEETKCTEVRAYIPVKGKWLERNVCLEDR